MECQIRGRGDAAVLLDHCAGKLDPRAQAALKEHLAACGDCRRWVEAQQAVWAALDGWVAPPVSAGFDRSLYARLEREQRPAWWSAVLAPLRALHLKPALSLAAISALAVGLLVTRAPRPVVVTPQQQAQADTLDADRLERALDDAEMLRQLPSAGPQAM